MHYIFCGMCSGIHVGACPTSLTLQTTRSTVTINNFYKDKAIDSLSKLTYDLANTFVARSVKLTPLSEMYIRATKEVRALHVATVCCKLLPLCVHVPQTHRLQYKCSVMENI